MVIIIITNVMSFTARVAAPGPDRRPPGLLGGEGAPEAVENWVGAGGGTIAMLGRGCAPTAGGAGLSPAGLALVCPENVGFPRGETRRWYRRVPARVALNAGY